MFEISKRVKLYALFDLFKNQKSMNEWSNSVNIAHPPMKCRTSECYSWKSSSCIFIIIFISELLIIVHYRNMAWHAHTHQPNTHSFTHTKLQSINKTGKIYSPISRGEKKRLPNHRNTRAGIDSCFVYFGLTKKFCFQFHWMIWWYIDGNVAANTNTHRPTTTKKLVLKITSW